MVQAIWDYWEYYEPIRVYAEQDCISNVQKIVHMTDNILIGLNDSDTTAELKGVFGLPNVTYSDDFAGVLTSAISAWQSKIWDPALNDPAFDQFCSTITNDTLVYSDTKALTDTAKDVLTKGGYGSEVDTLITPMLNWIGWLAANVVDYCGGSQDDCFSARNPTYYAQDSIKDGAWRSWPYQYCTEWGFLQTGSGVPADQLPLISRTNNLEYMSIICVSSFNITTPPNTDAINKYGGYALSYPRLAIIDGEQDPWRPACPHASPFNATAQNRTSTTSEPFILIQDAVHHWDEYGLFRNETVNKPSELLPPQPVRDVHKQEIDFVRSWMEEWEDASSTNGRLEVQTRI